MLALVEIGCSRRFDGDGRQVCDWIHVDDHCAALQVVLEKGRSGATTISAAAARRLKTGRF